MLPSKDGFNEGLSSYLSATSMSGTLSVLVGICFVQGRTADRNDLEPSAMRIIPTASPTSVACGSMDSMLRRFEISKPQSELICFKAIRRPYRHTLEAAPP